MIVCYGIPSKLIEEQNKESSKSKPLDCLTLYVRECSVMLKSFSEICDSKSSEKLILHNNSNRNVSRLGTLQNYYIKKRLSFRIAFLLAVQVSDNLSEKIDPKQLNYKEHKSK